MIEKYQKPAEFYDGLRLHQNENTGGCSPRVLAALASLSAQQVGFYPPYNAATQACAAYLGVDADRLSLVNGLDEGIMATAVAYLRSRPGQPAAEAIIPEPAFEIFAFDTEVVGGAGPHCAEHRLLVSTRARSQPSHRIRASCS